MTDTGAFAGDLKRIVSDKSDAGTFGRFDETPVTEMNADMKSAYDYTIKMRRMVPGPHKIYLSNPKLLRTIVPTGAYFQTESTLTSKKPARKDSHMSMAPVPAVTLTPVAYFPEGYFLENLAVRADGSVLVTTVQKKELWCVPGPEPRVEVPPVLVATFENYILPVAEAEPDVFIIGLSDLYSTHESHLARVDLNGWTPGKPVTPEIIFTFDERARGLNGSCMLGPGVLLVADCFAGLIWRVDLTDGGRTASPDGVVRKAAMLRVELSSSSKL
jgi:hypothetical protein